MSRFTGRQFRGAGNADRAEKRREAEARLDSARISSCGHRHTFKGSLLCKRRDAWVSV